MTMTLTSFIALSLFCILVWAFHEIIKLALQRRR